MEGILDQGKAAEVEDILVQPLGEDIGLKVVGDTDQREGILVQAWEVDID